MKIQVHKDSPNTRMEQSCQIHMKSFVQTQRNTIKRGSRCASKTSYTSSCFPQRLLKGIQCDCFIAVLQSTISDLSEYRATPEEVVSIRCYSYCLISIVLVKYLSMSSELFHKVIKLCCMPMLLLLIRYTFEWIC